MSKLSIAQKIFIGFFILIILSASFLLISLPSLTEINILSSRVIPLSREMDTLQKYIEKVKHLQNKIELYLAIRSEESHEELFVTVKQMNEFIDKVKQQESLSPLKEVSELLAKLSNAANTLVGFIDNRESAYKINLQIITVNKLFEKFEQTQEVLSRARLEQLQKNVNLQKKVASALLDRLLFIEVSIIIFGFFASFFLSKLITRNLSKLRKGTQEIASGNFEAHIDVTSTDEIGQLANSFNVMAEELRKTTVSKEYVDNIIRSMAETLVVVNPDFEIRNVNKATCELLGYTEEELINKPIKTIFSIEGTLLGEVEFENLIKEAKLMNCELNYLSKNAKKIPVLLSTSVMKDKYGNTICIIFTATDITEHKIVQDKLKVAMEAKSKFTSMVSHELRTPLAAIKTGVKLVLDGLAGGVNAEQKDFLTIVRNNVDRLDRLINNVLDLQKLESGRVELNIKENDINEIIEEIYAAMHLLVEGRGLKFILRLENNLPKPQFDKDAIAQVLTNLINNAVKFTEAGDITVNTWQDDKFVHVAVQDTGSGIKNEDIHRLFHAFEQLERKKGKKTEGTGLGLVICKEIIEKHGGRIWAESEFGKGSTFHFTLPR
ncbi:MAG: ATP-binding protein [Candidatus Omnitrophota bacterium]|nr:ATP-binding protein [Candidatus Omnitrophota bacterium]